MSTRPPGQSARLEVKILAAFRQACHEGEVDAAEYLMRALEALAEPSESEGVPSLECRCMYEAYTLVADGFGSTGAEGGSGSRPLCIPRNH